MSKSSVFLPVIVDYKRKKQKLRFLMDKTAEQTVSAIMKKLKVKDVSNVACTMSMSVHCAQATRTHSAARPARQSIDCSRKNFLSRRRCAGAHERGAENVCLASH